MIRPMIRLTIRQTCELITVRDSFSYIITDADGDTSEATVNVTVDAVDDTPTAVDDALTVEEDSVAGIANQIDVSTNDAIGGDGGDGEDFVLNSAPSNGTVTELSDGVFEYIPNADFNGTDSFTYDIEDVDGDIATATVNITVNSVNDLPIAQEDAVTVSEDSGANTINVLADNGNGADSFGGDGPNIGAITLGATAPANGTVSVNDNGTPDDPTDDTIDYTPNTDFNGSDSFSYIITDADGDTSEATVSVTVDAVDDTPTAVDDTLTVEEDSVAGIANQIDVSTNDAIGGDGGDGEDFVLNSAPSNGTVTELSDGVFEYIPNADFNGTDSFTYDIEDIDGDIATATVNITVNSVNDLPIAQEDAVTVSEDSGANTINVLADNGNGADSFGGDGPNIGAITLGATAPANGTVSVNDNGTPDDPTDDTIDYTPNADFNGSDSFSYIITDADGDTSEATVSVTVDAVDDTPTAVDDALTVEEDSVAG